MYHCSVCKLGVIVLPNEKPIKACTCVGPIVAAMGSKIEGRGGMNVGGVAKIVAEKRKE